MSPELWVAAFLASAAVNAFLVWTLRRLKRHYRWLLDQELAEMD